MKARLCVGRKREQFMARDCARKLSIYCVVSGNWGAFILSVHNEAGEFIRLRIVHDAIIMYLICKG